MTLLKSFLGVLAVLLIGLSAGQAHADEQPALKTQMDKVNYGIGVNTIRNFRQQGIEINLDVLVRGMKDALSGEGLLISEEDLQKTMVEFQTELIQKQKLAVAFGAKGNKKEGDTFLAANKKKDGIVALPSGLQYRVIKAGDGQKPTETDTVECRYRGTLLNGTEFENLYRNEKPATLKVSGVIPGLSEALKQMPVGSKWQLYIPPHLAYGERGVDRVIGPNATLIYDLELIAIK